MNTLRAIHAASLRDDPDYRAAYQALAPEFARAADTIDRRMALERTVIEAAIEWYTGSNSGLDALSSAVADLLAFELSENANAPADQTRALTFTPTAIKEPQE